VWNFSTVGLPIAPTLVFPTNGLTGLPPYLTLDWDSLSNANSYKVQISTVSNFAVLTDSAIVTTSQYTVPAGKLQINYTYFWRVCASNSYGTGPWSVVWHFTVNFEGVNLISGNVPEAFKLYPNYPNPFNPATKIKFDLAKASLTKLIVYDALGRELETLANRELQAGTYEFTWNASKYNSGIYFVRIISDKYIETKKMALVK
jgi:hypothetical protein